MKKHALNTMQSHAGHVKRIAARVGSVILRGIEAGGEIHLLEGSHRIAFAVELGLPVTIVLFGKDEVVPHDCDDIESSVTGLSDRATAGELIGALIKERELLQYSPPVYESRNYPNIHILKPLDETGETLHGRLIKGSPFAAFPEKVWVGIFGLLKDVTGKKVLVLGDKRAAEAFSALGAAATYAGTASDPEKTGGSAGSYDLIYAAGLPDDMDLRELFALYQLLLKHEGLAVTLHETQTPELIASAGLKLYAFFTLKEKSRTASFVTLTK